MTEVQVRLDQDRPINIAVPAAKLHVLQLEPIKAKVGEKWPRLSKLVHSLFERALRKAQGPIGHFIPVGELAYVATFPGLSTDEAAIACSAIAQEVCELLFGDGAGEISVRSLVGTAPESHLRLQNGAELIAEALERTGREVVVTKTQSGTDKFENAAPSLATASNYQKRLFPVWDTDRFMSSFLFLSPVTAGRRKQGTSFRSLCPIREDEFIADLEIGLLKTAGAYALRVQSAGKICAIGAGVSWETLSAPSTRHRYVGAIKALQAAPNCPLLVKIEEVPAGMPLARLAEMVAMLGAGGVRVLIEFASDIRIPDLNIKLGAVGIGTRLPIECSFEKTREIMGMLNRRLLRQSAFSFVGGVEHWGVAQLANELRIRFVSGEALDKGRQITAPERIPDFPLRSDAYWSVQRMREREWRQKGTHL